MTLVKIGAIGETLNNVVRSIASLHQYLYKINYVNKAIIVIIEAYISRS
jgi:hypothetical protein